MLQRDWCGQNTYIILGLTVNTVGRSYVVTWQVRHLHCNFHFCISNLIMKLEMTIFVIHKLLVDNLQSNPIRRRMMSMELKVLTSLRYKNLGHLDLGRILIVKDTLINIYTTNKSTSTRQSCANECRIGGTRGCYWPRCHGHHY